MKEALKEQGVNEEEVFNSIEEEKKVFDELKNLTEENLDCFRLKIPVKVHLLPEGKFKVIKIELKDTVHEIMQKIAHDFHEVLLPPEPHQPLDQLFTYSQRDELIGPLNLKVTFFKLLREYHPKLKFGLNLALVIKVNTSWKIVPQATMTPKEILKHFGMDHTQFTLYLKDRPDPLPIDTPIKLHRGECFEALKDGKYGHV